jgi:hybrid polyketide synthase/nonribosomal peptide synthetase ACE1
MIAVGTSSDDGDAMCELEDFKGRINVAACNSPESITISGDSDAIDEVRIIFEEEGKFVRPLQVSTAYHSHHMLLCYDAYVKAIQDCKLQCLKPEEGGPTWYSSVEAGARMEGGSSLEATYWAENMTSPVLFTHAIECALEECEVFDLALEIGPHPALKGPVVQTLLLSGVDNVPYIGVLNRGKNDLRSFLDALGFIWCHAGALAIDFLKFQKAHHSESGHSTPMKGLPTYAWNHERDYWSESRKGRQYRTQQAAIHDFLGRRTDDGMENQWRWENVLSVRENPWLSGHALQGVGESQFPLTFKYANSKCSSKLYFQPLAI